MLSSFFFQFDTLFFIGSITILSLLSFLLYRKEIGKKPKRTLPVKDTIEQRDALNKELAPFGFAYEIRQDIFYSLMECWQRDYGYCKLYDDMAPTFNMIIDCEPVTFEYNGKKWLIELWKGQYGMTTGAEIGVYNTTQNSIHVPDFFDGLLYHSVDDSERLYMSYSLRKGNEVLFTRNDLHWWLTGFKLAMFSEPSELTMDVRITFPNRIMCNAFVEALIKIGYAPEDVLIRYHSVFFVYDKPHSPQPETRNNLTEYLVQKSNKLYCDTFEFITRDYDTTLDKLEYLRIYSPKMFATVLRMGSDKELFKHFELLKSYEDKGGS